MSGSDFLKTVKEIKKRMKKYGKQHWRMVLYTSIFFLSALVFPNNLFILLKNFLATFLSAEYAAFGAVAAQALGMLIGFGGVIGCSWKAGNSRNDILSKVDDLSTEAIKAAEQINELEKQLTKEKEISNGLRDQLQEIKSEERVNRNSSNLSNTYEQTNNKQNRRTK